MMAAGIETKGASHGSSTSDRGRIIIHEELGRRGDQGFKRASKTLRGITGFEIVKQTAHVEKNKIVEFRVTMRVIFVLED